jgi:U2 small nuclear ribonucleoprotein A'
MRLTADFIKASPTYLNPLKEREISFRGKSERPDEMGLQRADTTLHAPSLAGNKIPAIENLGVTEDQYQAMDFGDNELLLLDNFPLLNKLVRALRLPPIHCLSPALTGARPFALAHGRPRFC